MGITQRVFGHLEGGGAVTLYTLSNNHGLAADITDYGGIIVSLSSAKQQAEAFAQTRLIAHVTGTSATTTFTASMASSTCSG